MAFRGGRSVLLGCALLGCALLAAGCNNGNVVASRVACYPPCLVQIVQHCPMVSACNVQTETDPDIPNPELRSGVAACFASGERQWTATNATTGDSYTVVKQASGRECYTAIKAAGSMTYAISVAEQALGVLDAESQTGPPTITCGGTSTDIVVTPDCTSAPWVPSALCEQAPCTFGAFPAGAATDM
jgi:hypothetical protein